MKKQSKVCVWFWQQQYVEHFMHLFGESVEISWIDLQNDEFGKIFMDTQVKWSELKSGDEIRSAELPSNV